MSTVVYLANQQIQVITGNAGTNRIAVSDCYTADAPDGSIINGIVMDTDSFVGFMKSFWQEHKLPLKDVVLVINSTKFIGKTIELPVLNQKKTEEFIEREFADIRKDGDYLCRYFEIGSDKAKRKLYAEIIGSDFIGEYLEIFKAIGVRVKKIYSGESSLIRLARMTVAKQYATFVLQIADRMTITTLLWVNGEYCYLNHARYFHEQGTEEYAQDVARTVSQIRQFMQANQLDYPIEAVVLAGVEPSHLLQYQSAIEQLEIYAKVEIFSNARIRAGSIDTQMFFPVMSGLVESKAGRQNFLDGYSKNNGKKEKSSHEFYKSVLPIAISLAVMIILLAIGFTIREAKKVELSAITEYNESPDVILEVARYTQLLSETTYLSNQYNAIEGINENLYTYPLGNREILSIIDDCAAGYATVVMDSFDADEGTVAVTASADTVDKINVFIKNLCEVDEINSVDYTGYSYVEQDACWDIHVTFTLAESAGR